MYPAVRLLISVSAIALVATTVDASSAFAQAANVRAPQGGRVQPGATPTVLPNVNAAQVMGTTQTEQDDDKPKSSLGGYAQKKKVGDDEAVDPEGDGLIYFAVRKPEDQGGGDENPDRDPNRDPDGDPNREPDPNDPVDVDRAVREVVNLSSVPMPRSVTQDEDGNIILTRDYPCPNDDPGVGAAAAASQKAAASGSCGSGINGSCNVGSNAISELGPDGKPVNQIASLAGGAGHSAPMSTRTNKPLDDHVNDCSEDPTGLACTGTGAGVSETATAAAPPPPPPPTCTGVPLPGNAPAPVVEALGSVDVALDCDSSHATMGCRPKNEKLRLEQAEKVR